MAFIAPAETDVSSIIFCQIQLLEIELSRHAFGLLFPLFSLYAVSANRAKKDE